MVGILGPGALESPLLESLSEPDGESDLGSGGGRHGCSLDLPPLNNLAIPVPARQFGSCSAAWPIRRAAAKFLRRRELPARRRWDFRLDSGWPEPCSRSTRGGNHVQHRAHPRPGRLLGRLQDSAEARPGVCEAVRRRRRSHAHLGAVAIPRSHPSSSGCRGSQRPMPTTSRRSSASSSPTW